MHYINFDHNVASHDAYGTPHIPNQGFVRFASGEVIFIHPQPTDRGWNRHLGIQIVATGDDDCPSLYIEPTGGDPIPKAWLNQKCMQYLAIDHECGVAIRLATGVSRYGRVGDKYRLRDVDHFAPHYLTGRFAAYWAGPSRRPIGDPIETSAPYKFSKEEKRHLQDLKDQADVWAAMMDLPKYPPSNEKSPQQLPAYAYFNVSFPELSETYKKNLHYHGWANFRVKTKHPYLYVRKT